MQCPNDDELLEEYQRRCAGEPLHYAAHLTSCAGCQQRLSRLSVVDNACQHYQEPSTGDCPEPAVLATMADGLLKGAEQQQALAHLAGCPTCRDQVKDLAMLRCKARANTPASTGWLSWFMPLVSACAGAAVMFVIMTVVPPEKTAPATSLTPPANTVPATPLAPPPPPDVSATQGTGRGQTADPGSGLRAVMPLGSEDLGYAESVWKSALKETENTLRDNPHDVNALRWKNVLKHGLGVLSERGDTTDPADKSTVDDSVNITPKFKQNSGLKGE